MAKVPNIIVKVKMNPWKNLHRRAMNVVRQQSALIKRQQDLIKRQGIIVDKHVALVKTVRRSAAPLKKN